MDSKLQIISGKYRARKLFLPPLARPTQNRARAAVFNMLESGIAPITKPFVVWDAFAGSGAFGIECLSRYENASVIFTDNSANSFKIINKNLVGISGAYVEMTDALNAVKRHGAVSNLVFIDPPYADADLGQAILRKLAMVAMPGTVVVWEMENTVVPVVSDTDWTILRDKKYGVAHFLILVKN